MTENPKAIVPKRKKHRSPSYPASGLKEAIDRARVIWTHENKHPVSISVAAKHWKYSEKSSGARSTVSALVKYGLVIYTDDASSQFRLTDRALSILLGDEEARLQAVKKAALAPKIYADLWSRFGPALPSDDSLRSKLLLDYDFNRNYVDSFIKDFRGTIEFAKLRESDKVQNADGKEEEIEKDEEDLGDEQDAPPPPPPPFRPDPTEKKKIQQPGTMIAEISVPLAGNQLTLALVGTEPVTDDDIEDIDSLIDFLKRQLRRRVQRAASPKTLDANQEG